MASLEQMGSGVLPGQQAGRFGDAVGANRSLVLLSIFLFTVFLPIAAEVAGLRLSPSRILLLLLILPFAGQCLGGKFGRVTIVDGLMVAFGLWIFLSLIVVHGAARIPFAGITAVELMGGYFVGRALVRNPHEYRYVFRFILVAMVLLLPFALVENLTARLIIPDLFRPIFETPTRDNSARGRMGLERVQAVFDHPILWGMFCAITLANFIMALKGAMGLRLAAIGLSIWLTMMSLSSGPLLAVLMQFGLLAWGRVMQGRWVLLLVLSIIAYVVVDLISNRTPIRILISYATFNSLSAFTRLEQFDAGMVVVRNNPIFGIGFNDWARAHWIGPSVDNFWLLTAMRHGVIGFGLLLGAFVMHLWLGARARISDADISRVRLGHLIAFVALGFVMVTVHVWGNVSIFVMFYLGAGAWIYTTPLERKEGDASGPDQGPEGPDGPKDSPRGRVYSRFSRPPDRLKDRARPNPRSRGAVPAARISAAGERKTRNRGAGAPKPR